MLNGYGDAVAEFFSRTSGIWVLYQIGAALAAAAIGWLVARRARQVLNAHCEAHPETWLRRWRRVIGERVWPVVFLILIWLALAIFREITWPSNMLLLTTFSKLATAWIIISLAALVIRNRFFFHVVSVALWVVAALSIVGLLPGILDWLDAQAFTLGETTISALSALKAVLLAVVLFWAVGITSRLTEQALRRSSDISPSMQVLFAKLVRITLVVVAIVMALTLVGIDLTAFAVFGGAVGVGIGFGLQKTVSNFISGISLLLDKSIKPGDVISVGDTFGWVTRLNTRYTSVVTRDGREHLIPNENLITNEVVNWSFSDKNVRLDVPFGVSYSADPHKVRDVVLKASRSNPRILNAPAPVCHFAEMGDSSLNFVFRFWIADPQGGLMNVKSDDLFMIWDALKENGIEIPFPQRDVHFPQGLDVRVKREE